MGIPNPAGDFAQLIQLLQQVVDTFHSLHADVVVGVVLKDSMGLLLRTWSDYVITTTDVEHQGAFTNNPTVVEFEPAMQGVADAVLVLAIVWAAYRIMWGHGVRTQYTARVLLPRVFMGAVLANFAMPMFQATVDASNVISEAVYNPGNVPGWSDWLATFSVNPADGIWQVLVTGVLVVGYDVLAVAYIVRFTILVFLAISAPIAAVLFVIPDTLHIARLWRQLFVVNLFMQPIQLFVLSVGFALEREGDPRGVLPLHHLFALASLLIVFKVPGAMGSAEKIAHKLASTAHTGMTHLEHALARA